MGKKKVSYSSDYLNRKVKQCRKLIRESKDADQRKVYRGYLKLWEERAGPKPVKEEPEEELSQLDKHIILNEPIGILPKGDDFMADEDPVKVVKDFIALEEVTLIDKILDEPEPEVSFQTIKEITGLSIQEILDEPIELPETPIDYAEMFEKEFPNKMAYRRKDGKLVETIAFKEYLKNNNKPE